MSESGILRNEEGQAISTRLRIAHSFSDRSRGFLGYDRPDQDQSLLLDPCGSIHTFGMRFALDVLFLDRHNRVLRVLTGLPPWRIAFGGWRARKTIECAAGALPLPKPGEQLTYYQTETP